MTALEFKAILAYAFKLGMEDAIEGHSPRTGKTVFTMCTFYTGYKKDRRKGHIIHTKHAYSAGRFHVESMGK